MDWQANCGTTAMGIMPHTSVERALELVMEMDVPFWPQLPKVTYYEDMYAQVSDGFPGIHVDVENERVSFDTTRFLQELGAYSERLEDIGSFELSPEYSVVFHRFLEKDLSKYISIRGQSTGPVSFGFKIVDENLKPIIYNDEVRSLLYDFIQRKVNAQYRQMRAVHPEAFVWVDEPGLGWVFNSLSGYNDVQVKEDYHNFIAGIEGLKAIHLCANVNLPYLLELGLDMLSFDAYQLQTMPKGYSDAVAKFIEDGGCIAWGIVPTDSATLEQETPETLAQRITDYWRVVADNTGISGEQIARQSLIAPARCCLKNISAALEVEGSCEQKGGSCTISSVEERIAEQAFSHLWEISDILKHRYGL